jgi:hypothetical protein
VARGIVAKKTYLCWIWLTVGWLEMILVHPAAIEIVAKKSCLLLVHGWE